MQAKKVIQQMQIFEFLDVKSILLHASLSSSKVSGSEIYCVFPDKSARARAASSSQEAIIKDTQIISPESVEVLMYIVMPLHGHCADLVSSIARQKLSNFIVSICECCERPKLFSIR